MCITVLFAIALPLPTAAAPGLGITLSIDQADQTEAELSGEIWIGIEQGESATRTLNVRSLSDDTDQLIELNLFDQIRVNGATVTDYTQPSRISDWVEFKPARPIVPAGGEVSVQMTFTIPPNAQDEAFSSVLNVAASSADGNEVGSEAGTQAVIKTRIALETNVWLGVGDALDLAPDFEIAAVDGALVDQQKYIRIYFQNNGIVSITPAGRLQLSDPAFADRVFEPIDFEAGEILEGQQGFVDVPVTEDVVDGFYRTFVTAESGGVRKTKLFEGNLVFDDPNLLTIPELALRIVMFVLASIGLVLGVRMLRRRKPQQPEPPAPEEVAPAPKTPKPGNKPATKKAAVKETENKVAVAKKQVAKPRTSAPARNSKKPATTKTTAGAKAKPTTAAIKQTQGEKVAPKPAQVAKTTRKTAPTSPRVRPQSKDTESK